MYLKVLFLGKIKNALFGRSVKSRMCTRQMPRGSDEDPFQGACGEAALVLHALRRLQRAESFQAEGVMAVPQVKLFGESAGRAA